MSLAPTAGLCAQLGTRPQRNARSRRVPCELVATTYTGWVGATFQLIGRSGVSTSSTSSSRASVSFGVVAVIRPHTRRAYRARRAGRADRDGRTGTTPWSETLTQWRFLTVQGFAAEVLGASLKGGRGDTVGPVTGAVLHGPLQTVLDLANVSDYRIESMDGVVTMFALILARLGAGEASA